eukprot:4320867-Pleurochrysis_carterae.AAC.1
MNDAEDRKCLIVMRSHLNGSSSCSSLLDATTSIFRVHIDFRNMGEDIAPEVSDRPLSSRDSVIDSIARPAEGGEALASGIKIWIRFLPMF